ncbi:MAG TPA: tetratricopeptide repeat protein [Chloroflexi bacterium]|nr:tetratricopeptide repeat protein [Chloroflexota bacterium]
MSETENQRENNDSWKQHFKQGMMHGNVGSTDQAMASFRQAIELAPDEPYPHYELGYTLFRQGQYEEALHELRTTDALSPGFFQVQTEIYLCECMAAGKVGLDGLEVLRMLKQLADLGVAQSEEAVALSRRAVELAPSCALGYLHLGQALWETNPPIAEKALLHCLKLQPDDTTVINAKMYLGMIRQAKGELDAARQIWQVVVDEYEGNPHVKMCQVLLSRHEPTTSQGEEKASSSNG